MNERNEMSDRDREIAQMLGYGDSPTASIDLYGVGTGDDVTQTYETHEDALNAAISHFIGLAVAYHDWVGPDEILTSVDGSSQTDYSAASALVQTLWLALSSAGSRKLDTARECRRAYTENRGLFYGGNANAGTGVYDPNALGQPVRPDDEAKWDSRMDANERSGRHLTEFAAAIDKALKKLVERRSDFRIWTPDGRFERGSKASHEAIREKSRQAVKADASKADATVELGEAEKAVLAVFAKLLGGVAGQ